MKLEEIQQIKQLYNENEINAYLEKGYKIIKIFSTKVHTDQVEQIQPCYVLAKGK